MARVARRQITRWPVGRWFLADGHRCGLAPVIAAGQSSLATIGHGVGKSDQSPGGGTVVPGGDYPARSTSAQGGLALRPVEDGPAYAELLARKVQSGLAGGAHALPVLTERRNVLFGGVVGLSPIPELLPVQ